MKIKETNVYLNKIGEEGKEIIFLHGWGQESSTFTPVVEKLESSYQVYLIDFPGFGKSKEPPYPYTLDDYVEILEEIIQFYKMKDPLIIGHSFGGRVAIKHANIYKTSGKLILVNSAGIKDKRTWKYYARVYTYKFIKRLFSVRALRKYKQRVLGRFGSSDYKNASEIMKKTLVQVVNEDLSEHLSQIKIPVVLFWGEQDTVTPFSHAKRMQELLSDSGLVTVKKAGHFSYLEDPYLLAKVIESFH